MDSKGTSHSKYASRASQLGTIVIIEHILQNKNKTGISLLN